MGLWDREEAAAPGGERSRLPLTRTAMDAETIEALNGLLEDERAAVEILVQLTATATDSLERQALTVMGGQAVQACGELHERLEHAEAALSARVSPSVERVLSAEHLDERYRAFGHLQQQLAERTETLLQFDLDPETQSLLATLRAMQLAQGAWAIQRADEFAASREEEPEAVHAVPAPLPPPADPPMMPAPEHTEDGPLPEASSLAEPAPALERIERAESAASEERSAPRVRRARTRLATGDQDRQSGDEP